MSKMIQIRNVPSGLHGRLKARAALAGMSLSDYLLAELRQVSERPTLEEIRDRLSRLAPVRTRASSADAVRAERDRR
jgi:plasmid stability protein